MYVESYSLLDKSMATQILVDSSVWIAFFRISDNNHKKAKRLITKYSSKGTLMTHKLILLEIFTILKMRGYEKLTRLYRDFVEQRLAIIDTLELDYNELNDIFFAKKDLSIVDSFIIYLALQKGYSILSFDKKLVSVAKKFGVSVVGT